MLPTALLLGMLLAGLTQWVAPGRADEAVTDPYLGQADAISEGNDIYHAKCIICHGLGGGRGPNLFATQLTDDQFLETVTNGRKGTLMPSFGFQLSPDEVWKVHAFIKAHPGGLHL